MMSLTGLTDASDILRRGACFCMLCVNVCAAVHVCVCVRVTVLAVIKE